MTKIQDEREEWSQGRRHKSPSRRVRKIEKREKEGERGKGKLCSSTDLEVGKCFRGVVKLVVAVWQPVS